MAETAPTMQTMKFGEAVNAALHRALREFPEALVFGEDVALPGGVFGCTKGLRDAFGERVFDTPISESAILGAGIGASLFGRRPILEVMWIDFTLVALDQLVNQAANVRYVSNGRLNAPITVRTQQGVLPGSCAQHSQSLEAFFGHIPGLFVAMPSSPADAYALLLAAIASDDPAIVIEHRSLYFTQIGQVAVDAPIEPVGGARLVREGADVTIVALGPMVPLALEAADALALEDVSAEVVDPRWIRPLDVASIVESVTKTGRIVIAHQANVTGGIGGEIAARVATEAFWSLEAPIERIGLPDLRVPAAPHLQAAVFPTATTIAEAARRALGA